MEYQRNLDELGRIVLPVEMRRTLALEDGGRVILRCDGSKIVLENAACRCKICRTGEGSLIRSGNDFFCAECIQRIKAL